MEIKHDENKNRFWVEINGMIADVEYVIDDKYLDITHTYVPRTLEGQGIASALVKEAYDYALREGLSSKATCSYAIAWLKRHPEYV